MRKKKVLGMMLSFTLAFGMVLPASMAMPLESRVIVSDSNAEKEEKRIIATDSDAIEEEKGVVTSGNRKEKKESVVVATDSNATKTESDILATDSNATKVTIEHIETCLEGCTGEGCECMCHMPSLFELLMATKTMAEFEFVVECFTEDELNALRSEEVSEIQAHIISIEPKPLPAIVLDDIIEDTVQSEIVYLTLSYTDVAPFGAPVVGK